MEFFIPLYQSLFDVKVAKTDKDIQSVKELRYQVYVNEKKWEPENIKNIECDHFDDRSIHLIMKFKPTDIPVGTVRLILPNKNKLHRSYPIQTCCCHSNLLNRHWLQQHPELSRFAIPKNIRETCMKSREFTAVLSQFGNNIDEMMRSIARGLSFGLIAKSAQVGRLYGYDGLSAVLEPSLFRLLQRNGLNIEKLGEVVEFHGQRQPCYFEFKTLDELLDDPLTNLSQLIKHVCNYRKEISV